MKKKATRWVKKNAKLFWGNTGSGILLFCQDDNTVLLTLRSKYVEQPGTWGIPGGAVGAESKEDLWESAIRETIEEIGTAPVFKSEIDRVTFDEGNFEFTSFILVVTPDQKKTIDDEMSLNWESEDAQWFPVDALPEDLHFGVQHLFEKSNVFNNESDKISN